MRIKNKLIIDFINKDRQYEMRISDSSIKLVNDLNNGSFWVVMKNEPDIHINLLSILEFIYEK